MDDRIVFHQVTGQTSQFVQHLSTVHHGPHGNPVNQSKLLPCTQTPLSKCYSAIGGQGYS